MGAPATLVSVEQYLSTHYEPACEYIDGQLIPKAMGTEFHGVIQGMLFHLILANFRAFRPVTELTLRLREGKYLIPDFAVRPMAEPVTRYPTKHVLLCVEILSPEDSLPATFRKCIAYLEWGVPHVWIVDPEARRAWQQSTNTEPIEVADTLSAGPISVSLKELFALL